MAIQFSSLYGSSALAFPVSFFPCQFASHTFPLACEKITRFKVWIEGWKVLLTNSHQKKKRGPKEVHAGNIYGFAHQAYWGFRFLSRKKKSLWRKVLLAKTLREIQEVGKICSQPRIMTGAGYGAAGLMTWLNDRKVAVQVLKAKNHRRYADSKRPSSEHRRMMSLGIAVAAGVWGIRYSTALRKLAEAGRGLDYMSKEVHRYDQLKENLRRESFVSAEPLGNYFYRSPDGKRRQIRDLPCKVPDNCRTGFIIHGFDSNGPQSTYSPTLPSELLASLLSQEEERPASQGTAVGPPPQISVAANTVRCLCGAEICAQTRKLALEALAEHKRIVYGTRLPSRTK